MSDTPSLDRLYQRLGRPIAAAELFCDLLPLRRQTDPTQAELEQALAFATPAPCPECGLETCLGPCEHAGCGDCARERCATCGERFCSAHVHETADPYQTGSASEVRCETCCEGRCGDEACFVEGWL